MVPSIYIPGTTPHCFVSTEGNVNFLGTRNLVYVANNGYAMSMVTLLTKNTSEPCLKVYGYLSQSILFILARNDQSCRMR